MLADGKPHQNNRKLLVLDPTKCDTARNEILKFKIILDATKTAVSMQAALRFAVLAQLLAQKNAST